MQQAISKQPTPAPASKKAQELVLPKNHKEGIGFHFVEKAIVFVVEDDTG